MGEVIPFPRARDTVTQSAASSAAELNRVRRQALEVWASLRRAQGPEVDKWARAFEAVLQDLRLRCSRAGLICRVAVLEDGRLRISWWGPRRA